MPYTSPLIAPTSCLLTGASPDVDLSNVLRGIAWLGIVSTRHVQRLWLPHRSTGRARALLTRLHTQGLVATYRWYIPRRTTVTRRSDQRVLPAPPRCTGYWWTLTKKGLDLASTIAGEPMSSVGLRAPQLLAHDRLVVETVIRIIELARPAGLCGVYVEREVLLNPPTPKPRMDSVIVVRLAPGAAASVLSVPWTAQPSLPGERSYRFGLEIDNSTEGNNELAVKALAYRQAATAPWAQRPGAFPLPIWVAPHAQRRDRIHAVWQQAWRGGHWLLTTEADLQDNRWMEYHHGELRERPLFAGALQHVRTGGQ